MHTTPDSGVRDYCTSTVIMDSRAERRVPEYNIEGRVFKDLREYLHELRVLHETNLVIILISTDKGVLHTTTFLLVLSRGSEGLGVLLEVEGGQYAMICSI